MTKGAGKPKQMKNTKGFNNNFNKSNKDSIPDKKTPDKKKK